MQYMRCEGMQVLEECEKMLLRSSVVFNLVSTPKRAPFEGAMRS